MAAGTMIAVVFLALVAYAAAVDECRNDEYYFKSEVEHLNQFSAADYVLDIEGGFDFKGDLP